MILSKVLPIKYLLSCKTNYYYIDLFEILINLQDLLSIFGIFVYCIFRDLKCIFKALKIIITTFLISMPLDMSSFHNVLWKTSCVIRLQNTCVISCLPRRYCMLWNSWRHRSSYVYTYIDNNCIIK